jgi:signal transduction histidine kinase
MEKVKYLNSLEILLPVCMVIAIISIGVVLLNFHFQKKLYSQQIERDQLKVIHQTELLSSSFSVQEEERKRIAQDLHDELGAILSIIRMNLKVLEDRGNKNTDSADIKCIRLLTENALTTVRNISHQLMPPQLEKFGLIRTLEAVIQPINDAKNIEIQLTNALGDIKLSWNTNLALYRITMELINNTIKHAKAQNITLRFSFINDYIECYYTDNGIGIVASKIDEGLGLKNIEGRVTALNGVLKWGNIAHTQGFFANIQIPI